MKKIAESFIQNLLIKNVLKLGKVSQSELIKMLAEEFADELKWGAVTESYLHKYKTKELTDLLNKKVNEGLDEDSIEIVFNIINILNQRFRQYNLETGDENIRVAPEEVDKILFPTKKIPPVERTDNFKIADWSELHIVTRANSKDILFQKMIQGQPSREKEFSKSLKELHLGEKTKNILAFFGMSEYQTRINYNIKSNIYAINKALKELFDMKEVPIKMKDGEIYGFFHSTYYDGNDAPVLMHHSFHDDNNIDMDTIASQEDTIDNIYLDDEENVDSDERPERDDGELDFSH